MKWLRRLPLMLLAWLAGLMLGPASWGDAVLAGYGSGQWRLARADGSVWRGHGQLIQLAPGGRIVRIEPVSWRLLPGGTAAGGPRWQLILSGQPASFGWTRRDGWSLTRTAPGDR